MKKKSGPRIWAVASGKGGVGKTFVSTSLGITLSKLGQSVVLLDLDTTGANIHTSLGVRPSDTNLRSYFDGSKNLQELVTPTPYPHLSYIQGFWDTWGPADFTLEQMKRLIPDIKNLNADFVVVDLGPGAMSSNLEIYRAADEKILVTTPEPTSLEKNYRFIESYICYLLKHDSVPGSFDELVKALRSQRRMSLTQPFSFRSFVKSHIGVRYDYFESLSAHPIRLIVNSTRSIQQAALGMAIKSVCNKYYDINIDNCGHIDFDNAVWQSIASRKPTLITHPAAPLSIQFLKICKHIIDPEELRAVV